MNWLIKLVQIAMMVGIIGWYGNEATLVPAGEVKTSLENPMAIGIIALGVTYLLTVLIPAWCIDSWYFFRRLFSRRKALFSRRHE